MLKSELRSVRLREPFRIAHGVYSEREILHLEMEGACGEAPFVPYYADRPEDVAHWISSISLGDGWTPASFLNPPRVAHMALEMLWYDLQAQLAGVPLWKFLNLINPAGKRGCRSLGIPVRLDEFAEKVRLTAASFGVIKLKLGSGDVKYDEEIVAMAKREAPDTTLFVDVNGGWSVAESALLIPILEKHGIEFVEQPIHADLGVAGWRSLRARLGDCRVPLFADESIQSVEDLEVFGELVDGVNIKLLKCGGICAALEMVTTARTRGLRTLLGCMIETQIGVTAAAHLAGEVDGIDLDGHLYLEESDKRGLAYDSEGRLSLPDKSGIGL